MISMKERKIYTIGTSNRTIDEFIRALKKHNIETAVDVRSFPYSQRFPHFNKDQLSQALEKAGIRYIYLGKELGGFRKGGYEKYMQTQEFKEGIKKLEETAEGSLTIFFCCEKLFFKCHRRFIAHSLSKNRWKVFHVIEIDKIQKEKLEP